MELKGKQALITGGAVRIGRAIAEALLDGGVKVIVHFQTSEKEADCFWPNIIQTDFNDPAQCETLLQRASDQFGKIDILINNAAVFHQTRLMDSTYEAMMRELQPNLLAPLALIRGFAKQTQTGKIINLLDRRVTSHDTGCVPYHLSKKALEELTKLAALELAPGITVNAVAPGAVLPPSQSGNHSAREAAGIIPLGKRPAPADIADAVLYLLKSDVITGQTLFIDGGQNLLGDN
ncbi:MAG: SDR family oxidoreductase [Pontiellaceae bacterium]|jgi:NAD(P)-dependent dehydrogenase (short-subunit alcohol dehydrogenase family)|nr:SDR family oxidoreductase [Pontiellaceae bacterium]